MSKKVLTGKTLQELEEIVLSKNNTKYRAKQIYNRLYLKSVSNISDMTDLPKDFREELDKEYSVLDISIKDKQVSSDGTIKFLFELKDGLYAESVLMRFDNRSNLTACISSQVGCPMGCKFCATAKLGFKRNLTDIEIVEQIHLIQSDTGVKVTNIVFMGQGEPLLNLNNVLSAIKVFRECYQVGARRITISTCGIIPGIEKLAELNLQSTLAISLHAADTETRKKIMPVTEKYSVEELVRTLKKYTDKTGRRITIEYTLIKGVNDSVEAAKKLAIILTRLKSNVNLIIYNSNEYCEYQKPDKESIMKFKYILEASGKKVTVRLERGADIDAACGQLSAKIKML